MKPIICKFLYVFIASVSEYSSGAGSPGLTKSRVCTDFSHFLNFNTLCVISSFVSNEYHDLFSAVKCIEICSLYS
jgi:hypothetical protein